ncbi:hypothetical protein EKD04_021550 [Chloroflexales bacterium ZM16-3]|nr:hypothetical protein [Chloroflexales bacterium ZM16-3]
MITMTRQLWRLDGALPPDTIALTEGLRLHLAHAPLTTVLVQIGDRRQSYVTLPGCDGCQHDRCEPGCRTEMLRRLLHQAAPGLTLKPVMRGLATRPYTRVVLATPGPRPQLLDAELMAQWPEARLALSWRSQRGRLHAGALLAVGADGPSPAVALHSRRWRSWPVPPAAGRALPSQRPRWSPGRAT